MATEANKAVIRRLQAAHNRHDPVIFSALIANRVAGHPLLPGLPAAVGDPWQLQHAAVAAMPDLEITLDDLVAEADKVVLRYTLTGTHRGTAFMGLPPTGRRIAVPGIAIFRLADGAIVEHWSVLDTMALVQQLGIIPPPALAGL